MHPPDLSIPAHNPAFVMFSDAFFSLFKTGKDILVILLRDEIKAVAANNVIHIASNQLGHSCVGKRNHHLWVDGEDAFVGRGDDAAVSPFAFFEGCLRRPSSLDFLSEGFVGLDQILGAFLYQNLKLPIHVIQFSSVTADRKMSVDTRQYFFRPKGFGNVVGASHVKGPNFFAGGIDGAEKKDWDVFSSGAGFQLRADFETIHVRHADV